jgi:hypothetical protein
VTERLPTLNFFWHVNIFIDRGSLRYEELFLAYLCGRNVGKHCSKWWSGVLVVVGIVLPAGYVYYKLVNKLWIVCVPPFLAVL